MAYDKIIPVRSRLDHCVSYVLNGEKTDMAAVLDYIGQKSKNPLETAINCDLETAYLDMMAAKRRWGKTGGVLGYHLIHSYAPGEVTPEEAHAAGVEFASRLLGDRYEAVVATHLDRAHLHCHILFNSVSFVDGRKYQNKFRDYFGDIRGVSNAVSRERGLSVIGEGPGLLTPGKRRRILHRPRKLKGIQALYFKYLYLLGALPRRRKSSVSRSVVAEFDRRQAQLQYLLEYHIETSAQLSMQYDALQAEIDALADSGGDPGRLRQLRKDLRLCAQIQKEIPIVRNQEKTLHERKKVNDHGRER